MVDTVIGRTRYQARPYQRETVGEVNDLYAGRARDSFNHLKPPHRSVMIESPTGSGKTCMALLSVALMQHSDPDLMVVWVAMRRNLLAQAARENHEKQVNLRNVHFVSMFDRNIEDLVAARQGRKLVLVADEGHHDSVSSMMHIHTVLDPEYVLGMTATPFRRDKMKLCFEAVVKRAGIHQLIQDGYLSRYDHYTIPEWTPGTVAEHYLREPERWGKSIFYFINLEQCFEFSHILNSAGMVNEVVTGSSDWEPQLERFRSGEVSVLVNCMKLTEGFDEPSLQTAWVRDSVRGPTMQMGGRVFRQYQGLPVKNIVQSAGTHWPFLRTALPRDQYIWRDGWLSLTINPELENINQNARLAIAQADVKLPKFLTDRMKKQRRRFFREE